jgi:hypothetical protein
LSIWCEILEICGISNNGSENDALAVGKLWTSVATASALGDLKGDLLAVDPRKQNAEALPPLDPRELVRLHV